jgi:hypothetical protein
MGHADWGALDWDAQNHCALNWHVLDLYIPMHWMERRFAGRMLANNVLIDLWSLVPKMQADLSIWHRQRWMPGDAGSAIDSQSTNGVRGYSSVTIHNKYHLLPAEN